jgi:hypothetical protein
VPEVLHHLALVLAVVGLGQAALRAASTITPSGLERAIVATVLAVATAVAEALALGLVGLGGSSAALVGAAAVMWAAAAVLLPAPRISAWSELVAWWRRQPTTRRAGAAALSGACLAWLAWQLHHPSIGFDSELYHYPLVAGWIHNGRPGSSLTLSYEIPYGNYPLTDEVALTWGAAIARSWIPLALWNPAMLLLLAAATWLTLRNLSVPQSVAALGTAALTTAPLVVRQLNEPQTDLPAFAWLACTASLATAAGRRPALLAPAIVAAGLAVGTKPSTGPMALAALAVGGYLARGRLRPLGGWLAVALGGAIAVGGVWYARNLLQHGSPLWPFASTPWADPPPRFLRLLGTTFLDRPRTTLHGRVGDYAARLGGTWVLLAAAPVALLFGALTPRLRPTVRRPLVVSGALAVIAAVIWTKAWGTGLPAAPEVTFNRGFTLSTLRFLLPALGAATVAVAVAGRSRGNVGAIATGTLAVAVAWSLVADARLGVPFTPPAGILVAGALAGVGALWLVGACGRRLAGSGPRPRALPRGSLAVPAIVATAVLLAVASDGYVGRFTRMRGSTAYGRPLVSWFLKQPGFEDGTGTIAIASRGVIAPLAGDHFSHPLKLVPQRASCGQVEGLARRVPVVVTPVVFSRGLIGIESYSTPRCLAAQRPVLDRDPFLVYRLQEGATGSAAAPR